MLQCDETCTCPLKEKCLGRRYPEWAPVMRAHWESDDPVRRQHVITRSQFSYDPPKPEPIPEPVNRPVINKPSNGHVQPSPPNMMTMAKSFVGTMAQEVKHVVTGGNAVVRKETFEKRLAICQGEEGQWGRCAYLQESPYLRCLKCGCDGNIAFRLPVKTCPIGRWGPEE